MLRIGTPPERLAVVGLPSTDRMFRQNKKGLFWQERGRSQPVCLFLSQTHGNQSEPVVFAKYKELVAQIMKGTPSITWKVKLHPMENDSFYRELGADIFSRLIFHPKQVSLEEAVEDADVVTTVYSTAGLEAMIMGRPLIVAPAMRRVRELAWWPTVGGGTYADSAEDFQTQLTNLVSDRSRWAGQLEQQHTFLNKNFANQGHAAQCVVDLLERYSRHRAADTELMNSGSSESPVALQSRIVAGHSGEI
jgi:lipid A disaccharide synthetase